MRDAPYTITWMDRRGAGRMRSFTDADALADFCDTLRREATIRRNGRIVGEVAREDHAADGRRKWRWHFDEDAPREGGTGDE